MCFTKGVAPHLGPWYHAALLFSGLGSIVLLFGVLFSRQIREDLVRAATSPHKGEGQENLNMASLHLHQPSLPSK